jgi:hypothetical protein
VVYEYRDAGERRREETVGLIDRLPPMSESTSMQFSAKGLLVFVVFAALLTLALSPNHGSWFYAAEATATVLILLGVAGFLGPRRVNPRRSLTRSSPWRR